MENKRQKLGRLSRRQYDQKKVRKCIQENPNFIEEILMQAFNPHETQVNLYNALADLRKKQSFLDLGVTRYLVGNGIIRSINKLGKNIHFTEAYYKLTKKGSKLLSQKNDME